MASLYGVPAGKPTVTPAAGASGSTPANPQPDPDQALQDSVARLMQQLQQPQDVAPPPMSHRILSALGDGLMNYASIIAGGGPVGTPSGDRLVAGQRARQGQENERVQTRNQATVRAFEIEQTNKRAGEREAAADKRATKRDAAIAARQAEDDKRAADAATVKEGIEARKRVAVQWAETLRMPGFIDWWMKVNPGQVSLDDLSEERVLRITESFLRDSGFDPRTAATAAEVNTALTNARAAQAAAPPGMDLTGITAGPYRFEKPKPTEAAATTESPATPTTRRAAANKGVWQNGMSEGAALEAISAKSEEDKVAREKRLNARTERGTKARDDIAAMMMVMDTANEALGMLTEEEGNIGGPIAGQPGSEHALALKDWMTGSHDLQTRAHFNMLLTRASETIRRAGAGGVGGAGANLTVNEQKLVAPKIPSITDYLDVKREKLAGLVHEAKLVLADRMKRFGVTWEDLDLLRTEASGGVATPFELPPGAKPIGSID